MIGLHLRDYIKTGLTLAFKADWLHGILSAFQILFLYNRSKTIREKLLMCFGKWAWP